MKLSCTKGFYFSSKWWKKTKRYRDFNMLYVIDFLANFWKQEASNEYINIHTVHAYVKKWSGFVRHSSPLHDKISFAMKILIIYFSTIQKITVARDSNPHGPLEAIELSHWTLLHMRNTILHWMFFNKYRCCYDELKKCYQE